MEDLIGISVIALGVLLTAKQAAELLGITSRHVARLAKDGKLTARRVGSSRELFFESDDLEKYKQAAKRGPGRPKKDENK